MFSFDSRFHNVWSSGRHVPVLVIKSVKSVPRINKNNPKSEFFFKEKRNGESGNGESACIVLNFLKKILLYQCFF